MKKLLAILLLCLAPLTAQAQSSKSTVISAINADFADNTAGAITAALLRTVTTQMVSSYVDFILCGAQGGMAYWDGSATPAPTCLAKGTNGQVLRTYNTPAWDSLANFLTAGAGISITGTITPTITSTITTGTIGAVPTSRIISSGAGLLGGGDLSADRTLSISATIAAAGPIGGSTATPVITFNDKGQLTAVSSATISTGSLGAVPTSRIISSGAGLSGGGDLSADRTLTVATNGVTDAMLSQAAAATLHGNPTAALANIQSFTISGLTQTVSPNASTDWIPITDGATGTLKKVNPNTLASAAVAGVSSIAGNTGAFTLANGIDNSTNQIQLTAARRTLPTSQAFTTGTAATYTTPANVLWVEIHAYGAGGGGGGCGATGVGTVDASGGGGGGAYVYHVLNSPAATYTYTVGVAGAGGAAGVNNGAAGTATTVNVASISAGGGAGGIAGAAAAAGASQGGVGGVAAGGTIIKNGPPATGSIWQQGVYALPGNGGNGPSTANVQGVGTNAVAGSRGGGSGCGLNASLSAVAGGNGDAGFLIFIEHYGT